MNIGVGDQVNVQSGLIELTETAYNLLDTGDNGRAVEYFERAAKMAREGGNASAVVPCYLNAGACLASQGKFQQGHSFLQSALKMLKCPQAERDLSSRCNFGHQPSSLSSKTAGSLPEDVAVRMSADIHHYLGVVHQGTEDYQKALAHFQSSVKLYMTDHSSGEAAKSIKHLSQCYCQMGDVEMEKSSLKRAGEVYHQLGDTSNEARICIELARIYVRERKCDDSKQMLSNAKLLCQRMKNCAEKRKLYSELGLLYISMGQFDTGMQSFEQSLMLIQKGRRTSMSLQAEASILQNIGAAYNDKAMFPEAVVYHKEAAAIHSKLGNYNSESKCLCNLASAQTQLDRLQEATVTFSKALAASHHADNTDLQLQAYEGLGSIQLQWGRHGEAVCHFERALGLLDIKGNSGIVRERIAEKLSESLKLLEQTRRAMEEDVSQSECLASKINLGVRKEDQEKNKEGVSNIHIMRMKSSLNPEFSNATQPPSQGKISPCAPFPSSNENNRGKPTLDERGMLPSLHTSGMGSPLLPSPSRLKPTSCPSEHGKDRLQQHPTNGDSESTLSVELQTYTNSYKSSPNASNDTDSLAGPSRSGIPVKEGSLAIGVQAREKFKVRTVEEAREKLKGKGAKGRCRQGVRNEIVSTSASPGVESISSEEQEGSGGIGAQARTNTQQQSKICTIL